MREQWTSVMQDRGRFWTSLPDWTSAGIERTDWTARAVHGLGQSMISGDLDAARRSLAPHAMEVGLWQIADGLPLVVRIARDRAMLVTDGPLDAAEGWQNGYALSPASDGWTVIELAGPAVPELLAEMTAVDFIAGSPSASLLLAGVTALLYRRDAETARIHVEAPSAAYLWHWLETRAGA